MFQPVYLDHNATTPVAPAVLATATRAWFHTDAVQALGKIPLDFRSLNAAGVHAMTLSAHKLGGPKGAACSAANPEPSHVLLAMGIKPELARGAVRVSFGFQTSADDVAAFLRALSATVSQLQALAAVAS